MRPNKILAIAALFMLGTIGAAFAGAPADWQLGLQEAASPQKAMMEDFHNLLLVVITVITLFVLGLLIYVMVRFNAKRNPTPSRTAHNTLIEVVWTVVPVLILLVIAIPSFRLLYFIDRAENPEMTLVVRGYQWYWGYEYPDQQIPEFASNMVQDADLQPDQVRLLSVDNPVVLPVDTDIQILVTAGDVLHSWAIPAFGLKRDAVPGRMNETWVRIDREGTYYGQCSELCGINHAFMPIEIRAVSREAFNQWVQEQTAGQTLETPPRLLSVSPPPAESEPAPEQTALIAPASVAPVPPSQH